MATYFHGSSEIQADGLQTLYLMSPNYFGGYSDTHQNQHHHTQSHPPNMFTINSAAASMSHAPPSYAQHFVGVPLPGSVGSGSEDLSRPSSSVHEIPVTAALQGLAPRFHYNLWAAAAADQSAAAGGTHPHVPMAVARSNPDLASPMAGFRRQGLSLSLSYRSTGDQLPAPASCGESASASASNGVSGMQSGGVIVGSKYLMAAQQLLDEVVNVGNQGINYKADSGGGERSEKEKVKKISGGDESTAAGSGEGSGGGENSSKRGAELTTAQRQELQMKKAKLVNMLDEVEQRYRQYHHEMQIVVSSFEQAAGIGSAKSYTALALQTISKQFRCLKDTIEAQIKAVGKGLGEDDGSGGKAEGSRLKFVDHQLRQQRALQQLGMIHHNAWRPQRGLPERAVSVLRAWLFEHFLHPYPKDSDKQMLAKQTGLSRSQVSNWFINARVRLWKPMVEEMYLEEVKDQEENGNENGSPSKGEPNKEFPGGSKTLSPQMDQITNIKTHLSNQERQILNPNPSPTEMEGMIVQRSQKKPKTSQNLHNSPSSIFSMDMETKQHSTENPKISINNKFRESYSFMAGNGFGAYPIGDIGRFDPDQQLAAGFHGNGGVSLTLGLPHCESLSQHNFLSNQGIMGAVQTSHYGGISTASHTQSPHSSTGYEAITIDNRKRFAAPLLPDFVA